MPLLFSLGQHGALQDASRTLGHGEHLMAFLDDTCYVSKPARVGTICGSLDDALWRNVGIRIHVGKTQIWNQAGIRPPICDALERVSASGRPNNNSVARVDVANRQTRHQIVGDAVGPSRLRCQAPQVRHGRASSPFATNSMSEGSAKAWLLLLHCASARANYFLRAVDPGSSVDPMMTTSGSAHVIFCKLTPCKLVQ